MRGVLIAESLLGFWIERILCSELVRRKTGEYRNSPLMTGAPGARDMSARGIFQIAADELKFDLLCCSEEILGM